jgi:adenine deaminase
VRQGSLITEERVLPMKVSEGRIAADPTRDLVKLCVLDRHRASGRIGKGFVQGLRLPRGAVAATFNPGLMNAMVLGVDDGDMAVCANRVRELQGGVVVALRGEVLAELALPVLGIVSDRPAEEVVSALQAVEDAICERLGCDFEGLLTSAGFTMCAVTIPALKICEHGLARIRRDSQEPVDLIVSPLEAGAR